MLSSGIGLGHRRPSPSILNTHSSYLGGGKKQIKGEEEKPSIFSKKNQAGQAIGFRGRGDGVVANSCEAGSSSPAGKERGGLGGPGAHPLAAPGGPPEARAGEVGDHRSALAPARTSPLIRRTTRSASERRQHEPVLTSAPPAEPRALWRYLLPARAATPRPAFAIFCWQR